MRSAGTQKINNEIFLPTKCSDGTFASTQPKKNASIETGIVHF
jgi:hypothetical protein